MLGQVMLSLLFAHLVVGVVLRMQHIQPIEAAALAEDLLFVLLLRLESVPLDAVDGLAEEGRQVLELKDAEEIPD